MLDWENQITHYSDYRMNKVCAPQVGDISLGSDFGILQIRTYAETISPEKLRPPPRTIIPIIPSVTSILQKNEMP